MRNAVLSIYPDGKGVWRGREKRWYIPTTSSNSAPPLQKEDQEALISAISMLRQSGLEEQALRLEGLSAQAQRLVPRTVRTRIRPDFELLMTLEAVTPTSGAGARVERSMLAAIHEAILLGQRIAFSYPSSSSTAYMTRAVEPHGILYGLHPYLLAWDRHAMPEGFRVFRLSDISGLEVTGKRFVRQEGFC